MSAFTDNVWKTVLGLVMFILLAVLALLMAFPVEWTWNGVMPYLFGFKVISWSQAWCLYFLSGCLMKASISSDSSD